MAAERQEHPKPAEAEKPAAEATPGAPGPAASGGIKAWLPLIINLALMPVLAYVTTTRFLLPKATSEKTPAHAAEKHEKAESSSGHGEAASSAGHGKFGVPLSNKIIVNLAGTMGTRYLLANLTLVSAQASLHDIVEKNDAALRDVAGGVLAAKTIADLEKPGARNLVRTELISAFNNVLGENVVSELYLTEFAIQ